jgi:hypothetical protein
MTTTHWVGVVVLAAGAGALGGSAVVWRATQISGPHIAAETAAAPSELTPRVMALEQAVSELAARPRLTLNVPPPAPSAPAAPASPSAAVVDDPVFEAAVRDVVQRVEDEHSAEHEAQLAEQRQAAAGRWANGLSDKLHLDDQQKMRVAEVAHDFYDRVSQALAIPDGGAPPSPNERRATVRTLRTQSEQKLGQILDPSQLASYDKLDDDDKLSVRAAWTAGR